MHKFYELHLGQERFDAYVADGGIYLIHKCSKMPGLSQDAQIGVNTSIHEARPSVGYEHCVGWYIMKYDNQPRISLYCLTPEQREELSRACAIPFGYERMTEESFFASAMFAQLRQWAVQHPKLAKRCQRSGSHLLVDWYAAVVGTDTPRKSPVLRLV